jgi:uncharacterized glyoxalase superfamily protein PhnB
MSLNTLTPNLMVEDVEATVEWYENVFDATLVATLPAERDAEPWWAQIVVNDTTLMFQSRDSMAEKFPEMASVDIGGSVGFYIDVDNAHQLHDELEGADVEFSEQLHTTDSGRYQFAVRDCNGYLLWFGEKVTNEPRGPIVR